MTHQINLCTSVLPRMPLATVVDIAVEAGLDGIELRIHDEGHQSVADVERDGVALRQALDRRSLELRVLNSYVPIEDRLTVDRLLACARNMGVPHVRLVLPRSASAAVARLSSERERIPAYDGGRRPEALLTSVRETLLSLEKRARRSGVKILVELHWGTIMSSLTAAYSLLRGIDPDCIAVTFDPANMIVEGREDWEFGLALAAEHIANVHVKNAKWTTSNGAWRWQWCGDQDGMVNWNELVNLLCGFGYEGDFAVEDFLTPRFDQELAISHLIAARSALTRCFGRNEPEVPVASRPIYARVA